MSSFTSKYLNDIGFFLSNECFSKVLSALKKRETNGKNYL